MYHIPSRVKLGLGALLAPQQNACHLCSRLLHEGEELLCQECERALEDCRIHPLEAIAYAEAAGESADQASPPLALCAYWHQDEARRLVHSLKYGHDASAALPLAEGMADVYARHAGRFAPMHGVVAVPIHVSRLRVRGYNQAELLARAFCGHTRLAFVEGAIERVNHSESQVERTRMERFAAMAHAFVARKDVHGMRLLLVDDVYTTGATAAACIQCLLEAGALSVSVLTAVRA